MCERTSSKILDYDIQNSIYSYLSNLKVNCQKIHFFTYFSIYPHSATSIRYPDDRQLVEIMMAATSDSQLAGRLMNFMFTETYLSERTLHGGQILVGKKALIRMP